jgi:hypothetical protein
MKPRHYVLIAAIALAVITADPAAAIIGGQPDGNRHPNVGALDLRPIGFAIPCSGTLVSPTVYVTAGHCTNFLESNGITQARVTFDPVVSDTARFYTGAPTPTRASSPGRRPIPGTSAWSSSRRRSKGSRPRPCRRPGSSVSSGHRASRRRPSSRSATGSRRSSSEEVTPNQTPAPPAHAGWPPRPSTRSRPPPSISRQSPTEDPVPAILGRRSSLGARSSPKASTGTAPALRWRSATGSIPLPPAPSSLTTSACRNPQRTSGLAPILPPQTRDTLGQDKGTDSASCRSVIVGGREVRTQARPVASVQAKEEG